MSPLEQHIRKLIVRDGPLSVAAYMDLALQHPVYGYYRQHDPLGRDGDFITAPEISQMFGEMLGLWAADVWRQLGQPRHIILLELGPGRGTLMTDMLRATAKIVDFHKSIDLYFLESNQSLRHVQQEKLHPYNPSYVDDLDQLPLEPTLIIANEFFDALPILQFEKTFQGWRERKITIVNNELNFVMAAPDLMPSLTPHRLQDVKPGFVFEYSPESLRVARQISRHVLKNKGAALIVDYGFLEPSGQSTFQAIAHHAYANVLQNPGEIDLTAHVDFHALKMVAQEEGGYVGGPLGQGALLKNLGIEIRAAQLKSIANAAQGADINNALLRLTDDAYMGALFKALTIASSSIVPLGGF